MQKNMLLLFCLLSTTFMQTVPLKKSVLALLCTSAAAAQSIQDGTSIVVLQNDAGTGCGLPYCNQHNGFLSFATQDYTDSNGHLTCIEFEVKCKNGVWCKGWHNINPSGCQHLEEALESFVLD